MCPRSSLELPAAAPLSSLAATMEHVRDELNEGTSAEHFGLARSHLWRAVTIAVCGGRKTPAVAAPAAAPSASEPATASRGCIILPSDPWKEAWDLFILAFILYSAVMVPYRICFSSTAEDFWFAFEQLVTLSFVVDVVFNFNTAYLEDERWVVHRGRIAVRYLQGWFWIDAPSSVPVELLDVFLEGDSSNLAALRFLRLFRLLRLLRLLKLGEYIANIEVRFDLNLTFLRIVTMLVYLLFLAHILGCFWCATAARARRTSSGAHSRAARVLAVAARRAAHTAARARRRAHAAARRVQRAGSTWPPSSASTPRSRRGSPRTTTAAPSTRRPPRSTSTRCTGRSRRSPRSASHPSACTSPRAWARARASSHHVRVRSTAQVGYGDITPTNDLERLYSLFALLTGALVFGYMLSSIGSLVAAIDRQAALSEEKMDEVY